MCGWSKDLHQFLTLSVGQFVHQNDTFAAESRNKKPGRKKDPENVCSATAASECCRYELPLPAAKYNMWPNRGRKWERGAITARGKEQGRNPGVTFLSQPSWNKGSGCFSAVPLFSSPPLPFSLLYLSHCVQDIIAYAFMADVQRERKPGWCRAPVSTNKTSLSTWRPLTCCLPGSVCHCPPSPPCS